MSKLLPQMLNYENMNVLPQLNTKNFQTKVKFKF